MGAESDAVMRAETMVEVVPAAEEAEAANVVIAVEVVVVEVVVGGGVAAALVGSPRVVVGAEFPLAVHLGGCM